jgi:hypothetical protein
MYLEHKPTRARVVVLPADDGWVPARRRCPINWYGACLLGLMAISAGMATAWIWSLIRIWEMFF